MALTNEAKKLCEELFGGQSALSETDPEFAEIFGNFAFDEVAGSDDLDEETRFLAVLASLVGCGGADVFARMLPAALRAGVKPVAVKEMLYQAAAYLGIGRLYPFLTAANGVLCACGISLPLAGQGRVRREERLAAGERMQIGIFGEGMRGWISVRGSSSPSVSSPHRAAASRSLSAMPRRTCASATGGNFS